MDEPSQNTPNFKSMSESISHVNRTPHLKKKFHVLFNIPYNSKHEHFDVVCPFMSCSPCIHSTAMLSDWSISHCDMYTSMQTTCDHCCYCWLCLYISVLTILTIKVPLTWIRHVIITVIFIIDGGLFTFVFATCINVSAARHEMHLWLYLAFLTNR